VKLADDLARLVLEAEATLDTLPKEILPKVVAAYRKTMGTEPELARVKFYFGDQDSDKDWAKYVPASGGDPAVVVIDPAAEKQPVLLRAIVGHELIHHTLETNNVESHGAEFQAMAAELKLPKKWRD
jgi:hypothetical protein